MIDEAFEEQCRLFEVIVEAWYREKIRGGSPYAIRFGEPNCTFRERTCAEIGRTMFGLDFSTATRIRKKVALRIGYKRKMPTDTVRFHVVKAA